LKRVKYGGDYGSVKSLLDEDKSGRLTWRGSGRGAVRKVRAVQEAAPAKGRSPDQPRGARTWGSEVDWWAVPEFDLKTICRKFDAFMYRKKPQPKVDPDEKKRQRLDGKKAGTRPSNEAFDKAFEQLLHAPLVQNDSTPAQSGSGWPAEFACH